MITPISPKNYLFAGSPFVASSSQEEEALNGATTLIRYKKITPLHALGHETSSLGISLNLLQVDEYKWILQNFKTNLDDLDWFLLGYTCVPTLIISACYAEKHHGKNILTTPDLQTITKRMSDLNQYKIRKFETIFRFVDGHLKTKPLSPIQRTYDYIKSEPYNLIPYFQLGVSSSKMTMTKLGEALQILMTPKT